MKKQGLNIMRDRDKVQKNLIVGLIGQVAAVILGILLPKKVLNHYGSEINGLLASITNIYSYLAIVEAGIAAAACQALYQPLAEGKCKEANAVLSACNRTYRKIGILYIVLIALLSVVYPFFVITNLSYLAVSLIILFNGIGSAVNFFFHAKYLILLKADGRQYVRSGLDMSILIVKQVAKIALISMDVDIVVVQSIAMITSVLQILWISFYVRRNYEWVDLKERPNFTALSQSKYVLAHEINYLITSNLDVMLLTAFSNLKVVSVYTLYAMLYGMIDRILQTIRGALEFKIAFKFHRNREAFLELFETYEVCYITFATALIAIVSYFVLPFLKQYTDGITDVNYLDSGLSWLFAVMYLFAAIRYPSDAMIHISGHFRQTKNSAYAETIINMLISVVMVQYWGIKGVLIGTIVSAFFRTIYLIEYVNKKVIMRSTRTTYRCLVINALLLFASGIIRSQFKVSLDNYIKILVFCFPYSIIILLVFFCVVFACIPRVFNRILFAIRCYSRNK